MTFGSIKLISRCRYYDADALLRQENEHEITSGPSCTLLIDYVAHGGQGCVWVESNESAGESEHNGAGVYVCAHQWEKFQCLPIHLNIRTKFNVFRTSAFYILIQNVFNWHLGRFPGQCVQLLSDDTKSRSRAHSHTDTCPSPVPSPLKRHTGGCAPLDMWARSLTLETVDGHGCTLWWLNYCRGNRSGWRGTESGREGRRGRWVRSRGSRGYVQVLAPLISL